MPLSEISYMSGGSPTTFSKAKRNIDNSLTTSSPGVGKYKIESGDKRKIVQIIEIWDNPLLVLQLEDQQKLVGLMKNYRKKTHTHQDLYTIQ